MVHPSATFVTASTLLLILPLGLLLDHILGEPRRWHPLVVALVAGAFLLVDIAFFAANVIKIPEGGWFPIVMGLISFTVLTTWRRGRKLVDRKSVV